VIDLYLERLQPLVEAMKTANKLSHIMRRADLDGLKKLAQGGEVKREFDWSELEQHSLEKLYHIICFIEIFQQFCNDWDKTHEQRDGKN
jgi:hypothetical protein